MMQDTILSLGKESVRQFVSFMMQYIPKETHIFSTSSVKNVFEKPLITSSEGGPEEDENASPVKEIPDSEMITVQKVRKEID